MRKKQDASNIRRELYHLYKFVLSKTKTTRINGSRLISVLDFFSCEYCPQQRQSKMARVSKLRCHGWDLPQRQYFEYLFNEKGGVFSYDKNPHLPQNYKKTMLSLCVCVFYVYSSEKTISSVTTQHFNNHCTPKKHTDKEKTKRLPVACQFNAGKRNISHQKLTHALYALASQFSSYKWL